MEVGINPYCITTTLTSDIKQSLKWWQNFLSATLGRYIRGYCVATLISTFGDGSGTDLGGTISSSSLQLHMWKGVWHRTVTHYSSNWKDLATLLITIKHILQLDNASLLGTTLFYLLIIQSLIGLLLQEPQNIPGYMKLPQRSSCFKQSMNYFYILFIFQG